MARYSARAAAALLAAAFVVLAPAADAAQRTFVASTGLDSNACSVGAPCRSFTAAAAQTSPGGEIIVLDSAGYGSVTIAQSLSIIAPAGIYAGIAVFAGTSGVVVGGAGISVTLRGLTINGQGGAHGIFIGTADYVHVENVVVSGMANHGIAVVGAARVFINDTVVRNNGQAGLYFVPVSGLAQVSVDRLRSEANLSAGVYVDNNVVLNVRDGVITRNFGDGIEVFPDTGEQISVGVERTTITNNFGYGVLSQGGGSGWIVLSDNTVKDNFAGGVASLAGAIDVRTRLNNTIEVNNGSDVSGPLTTFGGK